MDPLGDPLTTRRIQTGWELTIEPYPSCRFGFIGNPDHHFGNGSSWTRTRTWCDSPAPLLTLPLPYTMGRWKRSTICDQGWNRNSCGYDISCRQHTSPDSFVQPTGNVNCSRGMDRNLYLSPLNMDVNTLSASMLNRLPTEQCSHYAHISTLHS